MLKFGRVFSDKKMRIKTAYNKGFGVMVAKEPILGICNAIRHLMNNLSLAREN